MASFASLVNQKHYHASLLLAMQGRLDKHGSCFRAEYQALEDAAVDALLTAWQLFLCEVAESCQINTPVTSLDELTLQLQAQHRSHAVVQTLESLQTDATSWLSHLIHAGESKLEGKAYAAGLKQPDMLAVTDMTSVMEVGEILQQFQGFVTEQRDFLQEW